MFDTVEVTISLTLTNDEWVEVVASLDSKIHYVTECYYGEERPGDNAKWIADLNAAKDKIETALTKAGVTY